MRVSNLLSFRLRWTAAARRVATELRNDEWRSSATNERRHAPKSTNDGSGSALADTLALVHITHPPGLADAATAYVLPIRASQADKRGSLKLKHPSVPHFKYGL